MSLLEASFVSVIFWLIFLTWDSKVLRESDNPWTPVCTTSRVADWATSFRRVDRVVASWVREGWLDTLVASFSI